MRTLIDVPEPQIKRLDDAAREAGTSRAALVRQAIDAFLAARATAATQDAFGLWRAHAEDGLAYQQRVRAEW